MKKGIFQLISSLKSGDFFQNAGILRVLKNRELQNREIQNHELQGLPVLPSFRIYVNDQL